MLRFVIKRLGVMLLTALVLTFVVFYLTNLPPNLEKLARSEGSVRMTDESVAAWVEQNGHGGSVFERYAEWMGLTPGWRRTDAVRELGTVLKLGHPSVFATLGLEARLC